MLQINEKCLPILKTNTPITFPTQVSQVETQSGFIGCSEHKRVRMSVNVLFKNTSSSGFHQKRSQIYQRTYRNTGIVSQVCPN